MDADGPEREGGRVAANVVAFARVLANRGIAVGPSHAQVALRALAAIDATLRDDVYWALRASLATAPEHFAPFDDAFGEFWEGKSSAGLGAVPEADPPADGVGAAADAPRAAAQDEGGLGEEPSAPEGTAGVAASPVDRLGELDLASLDDAQVREVRRALRSLARSLPQRTSRRLEPSRRGAYLSVRATMRAAMRTGGVPVRRAWQQRGRRARRVVFLVDVSGSMRPYAHALLVLCEVGVRASRSIDAFTFGTRLTHLTPHLRAGADPDAAMARAVRSVPDWAGGTRIAENLRAFNRDWARRGTTRGAVVVIASDGWERGDVGALRDEMAALQRTSHRIVWLNPLAGDPGYEPLAAGMAAALPYVDVFAPGQTLDDVRALTSALGKM